MTWLADAYPWLLALHIVAVIAWMAGMLYLPRLYVYHSEREPGGEADEMLKVMERRLLRLIVNPSMLLVFLTGGSLLLAPGAVDWASGWIYAKLALVLALAAVHGAFAAWRRGFADGRNRRSARFYRAVNEIPTLLMIGIVVLVVVKPF
ncbi:MAG: protoporphyrinogen oxidase HemJ [Defluviicoccus sp.]|nr:protoporphyrinogen oxidase HemJ [Defluviicoccus sp.]MDE0384193.1 protoporphyrinogen oxidase HemJ [Defluviicoccus sp.]